MMFDDVQAAASLVYEFKRTAEKIEGLRKGDLAVTLMVGGSYADQPMNDIMRALVIDHLLREQRDRRDELSGLGVFYVPEIR